MDKDLEKLSALYDGELSYKEIQEGLDKMREDQGLKETFHKFGLISELVQRQTKQNTSKLLFFKDYLIKVNPMRIILSEDVEEYPSNLILSSALV